MFLEIYDPRRATDSKSAGRNPEKDDRRMTQARRMCLGIPVGNIAHRACQGWLNFTPAVDEQGLAARHGFEP